MDMADNNNALDFLYEALEEQKFENNPASKAAAMSDEERLRAAKKLLRQAKVKSDAAHTAQAKLFDFLLSLGIEPQECETRVITACNLEEGIALFLDAHEGEFADILRDIRDAYLKAKEKS